MLSKILSSTVIGIDGFTVNVETDLSNGFPSFEIVGLPGSAVKESKERVRTAIKKLRIFHTCTENNRQSCSGRYPKRRSGV